MFGTGKVESINVEKPLCVYMFLDASQLKNPA
jgi:hypothetical protein